MNSPSLQNVQRWMRSKIREGKTDLPAGPESVDLNLQRSHPGEERLPVYAEGYRARMREALAEVFKAVHHVISEKKFSELSQTYALKYPSHDYNLSLIGRHLPEFLIKYPLTEKLPFLPDLAALEWCVAQAFHAKQRSLVDSSTLSEISMDDWDQARFNFQSSVFVIESRWPIRDIWEIRDKSRKEIDVDLSNRPQHILIFRDQFRVVCKLIDKKQAETLKHLLDGQTLGSACSRIATDEEEPIKVTEWFGYWIQAELITSVKIQ